MNTSIKNQKQLLIAAPIIFSFLTIFYTYENINIFLLGGLILILFSFYIWNNLTKSKKNIKDKLSTILPYALILVGLIGLSAATTLTREKIELIKDPNYVTACSINPIVACSPVINSDQASAFGIPNPILGIFGFTALAVAGFSILAGGKFISWWWRFLWLGCLLGFIFSFWLAYQTLYAIGALCIYCMVVWSICIPIFYYVSLYNFQQGHIKISKKYLNIFEKNHMLPSLLTYGLLIILIYFRFSDYWNTLI